MADKATAEKAPLSFEEEFANEIQARVEGGLSREDAVKIQKEQVSWDIKQEQARKEAAEKEKAAKKKEN